MTLAQTARTMLILGGARSGKSRHAQAIAESAADRRLIFIATAQAFDAEMDERIARHREDRGPRWTTVDAPIALPEAIRAQDGADRTILVDCLTLWLSNLLLADADIEAAGAALVATLLASRGRILLVSNEVGHGIVPDNALARRFRDEAGRLHQRLAAACDAMDVVVAGIPMRWKG